MNFATRENPLRASQLPMLVKCPLRAALITLGLEVNTSGQAADTGSAVHKAVSVWHSASLDTAAALAEMRKEVSTYPLADLAEAERQFHCYAEDSRNRQAEIVLNEAQVSFAFGPPKARVWVVGTLDQVRREDGLLRVWDVKTGSPDGLTILHEHTTQLAAYCLGAAKLLKEPVHPGGVIRTKGYFCRNKRRPELDPPGVFFHASWTHQDCETLLRPVIEAVKLIRAGKLAPQPGEHCSWKCPFGGVDRCLPTMYELLQNAS